MLLAALRINHERIHGFDVLVVAGAAHYLEATAGLEAEVDGRLVELDARRLGVIDDLDIEQCLTGLPCRIGGAHPHDRISVGLFWHAQGGTDIAARIPGR
ncbi:hypothetical protein D9M71_821770 [compost metagenome]